MQKAVCINSEITLEDIENAKKSCEIIRKAVEKVSLKLNERGNHMNKIIKKELLLESIKNPMERMKIIHQIKVLDRESEQLQQQLRRVEKDLLAIPKLDEHVESLAKVNRKVANNFIRTINTIKHEHENRRD